MSVKGKSKINKVMRELKEETLHFYSKKGPIVRDPKQALVILNDWISRRNKN
jgi:hypothetical protein